MQKNDIDYLFSLACEAKNHAYAPYSNHPVGAALATDDGTIYTGCNVETAHFRSICAEGTAIVKMASAGHRLIQDIVVVGPGDELCAPCGDCRQRIREFADSATMIYVFGANGILLRSYTMDQLLPDSFGPENVLAV